MKKKARTTESSGTRRKEDRMARIIYILLKLYRAIFLSIIQAGILYLLTNKPELAVGTGVAMVVFNYALYV